MRPRPSLVAALLLVGGFLFVLIALFPLRVALDCLDFDRQGLSARTVTGSIWAGALHDARLGPVALGDMKARLRPLPLLLGRASMVLERDDAARPLEGVVSLSRGGFALDDVTGSLDNVLAAAPVPIARLDFDDVDLRFDEGRCKSAAGSVRAAIALPLGSAELRGDLRCTAEGLLIPLAGPSGTQRADLLVRADGRYRIGLRIPASDPAAARLLGAIGFRASPAGHVLNVEGRL